MKSIGSVIPALCAAGLVLAWSPAASPDDQAGGRAVRATAQIKGCTDPNITGRAFLTERPSAEGVKLVDVTVVVTGLPPGKHAVHIHAKALCEAPDFKTAAAHFNPENKQHGKLNPMGHHAGDLPQNVTIGEGHTGQATFKVDYLSLDPASPNSIIANGGTAIVVHEKPDDMKTDPTGNAGNRIACGVITSPTP